MAGNSTPVECVIPVAPVKNLSKSIAFYTETLGFQLDWGGGTGSCICSVSRDGHSIMLSMLTSSREPVWIWIGVDDESLFETYRSKGAKVRQEPLNHSWAYEMKFEDPDGNVLWLGTEPRQGEPFEDQRRA